MAKKIEGQLTLRDVFSKGLAKPQRALKKFIKSGVGGFASLAKKILSVRGLIVGLAGAFVIRKLTQLVTTTAAWSDQVGKLSTRLGLSTEFLSEMAFVGERSNVEFTKLSVGFQRLQRRLAEFQRLGGRGTAAGAFDILGLRDIALNARNVETLLPTIADRFSKLRSESEATLAAFGLFDSEGVAFLQFLKDGARGIELLREEAKKLGLSISPEDAKRAADFNDAMTDVVSAWKGLVQKVVTPHLPTLTEFLEGITETIVDNRGKVVEFFTSIGEYIKQNGPAILNFVRALASELAVVLEAPLRAKQLLITGELGSAGLAHRGLELVESTVGLDEGGARRKAALERRIAQLTREDSQLRKILEDFQRARAAGNLSKFDAFGRERDPLELLQERLGSKPGPLSQAEKDFLGKSQLQQLADRLGSDVKKVSQEEADAVNRLRKASGLDPLDFNVDEANRGVQNYSESLRGAAAAFDRLRESNTEFAIASRITFATIETTSQQVADAILDWADGAKSAEDAIKDAGRGILRTLTQIALRALITKTLLAGIDGLDTFFNGSTTQTGANIGPLQSDGTFHLGGIGHHGRGQLIEAHGTEAHIPTLRGRVPIAIQGGGDLGGGNTTVIYVEGMDTQDIIARLGPALQQMGPQLGTTVSAEYRKNPAFRARMGGTV